MDRSMSQNIARGQSGSGGPMGLIEEATAGDRDEDVRRAHTGAHRTYPIVGRTRIATTGEADHTGDDKVTGGGAGAAASITSDEAAALLRQGRLAVRISAPTVEQGEQSLRSARRKFDQVSEPSPLEPDRLGAALAVAAPARSDERAPMSDIVVPVVPPEPPATAGTTRTEGERDRSALPDVAQPASAAGPANTATPPTAPAPAGYQVTLPIDAAAIERFVSAVSAPGQRVEFIELPAPSATFKDKAAAVGAAGVAAPLDPAMIIWWTSPVRVWAVRAQLPVVVQQAP